MPSKSLKLTVFTAIICTMLVAGVTAQDASVAPEETATATNEERGRTLPYEEVELNFPQPGLISEVMVKDGQPIKAGEVLALQDDLVEQAALAREEYLLKSQVQLKAAEAGHNLAKIKMRRQEEMKAKNVGSNLEYDEAKAELIVAKLKIDLAQEETEAKRLDVAKLKAQLKRMRIVSPFDGDVRKVESAVGEVADPQKPSIIVVKNNPLKVATDLPTTVANGLKLGQSLQVRYADGKKWHEAKIIYFDPFANAGAGTQLVHLELPNPEGRRAGMDMVIKLPDNLAAAQD